MHAGKNLPSDPDLLARLRIATQEVHQTIERSVRFLDAEATVLDYRAYLGRLYGFVAPLEEALASSCAQAPALELPSRRKAHLIVGDLAALGLEADAIAALPACDDLPDVTTLQRALGCLYVLEGSTLGGRYIEHRLTQLRPEAVTTAHAYLRCYGRAIGERWRDFRAALERYASDDAAVIDAARATFTSLHAWLHGAAS